VATLRSLAIFGALYLAVLIHLVPVLNLPGLSAAIYLAAGFLVTFPIDRVRAFYRWASESRKLVRTYRTCVVATPKLVCEAPDWHFVGTILEHK
jgi:hypothetical protein